MTFWSGLALTKVWPPAPSSAEPWPLAPNLLTVWLLKVARFQITEVRSQTFESTNEI